MHLTDGRKARIIDAPTIADRHHVHVEVITLSLSTRGRLAFRVAVDHLTGGETPDEAATRIGDVDPDDPCLVHSTSWRHTPGAVILTYAVAPDPSNGRNVRELSEDARLFRSSDPTRPGSGGILTDDVVAHACRHLVLLADADPVAASMAAKHPNLWRTMRASGRGLAGQLETALHPNRLSEPHRLG